VNLLNVNPFLRVLLPFTAGILAWLLGYREVPQLWIIAGAYALCVLAWLSMMKKARTASRLLFGLLSQAFLLLCGWELSHFHYERNRNSDVAALLSSEPAFYAGVIRDLPTEKAKTIKAEISLQYAKVNGHWQGTSGKIIAYFEKDSAARQLQAGGRIVFSSPLREVNPPLNPNEFNYKAYLALRKIFYTAYLPRGGWGAARAESHTSLYAFAQQVRQDLLGVYRQSGLAQDEFAMVSALVLGYDDEIDEPLMTAYSHTGTLHVLSVSGLHVGVIYLMLGFLLSFMDRKRALRWLKVVIILASLWFFVLLSGFSAPAVRAALMFTLILTGKTLFEHVQVTNIVFVSAFLSLCYNPYWLADAGFQLSYLAVLGILVLYPRIYNLFTFSSSFFEKVWALCSVSIAAQVATLPLTLYYFHQLPLLFLLTNLVLIPASTLVMYGGMLILVFSKVTIICRALIWLTAGAVKAMNATALFFDSLPFCVIDGINPSLISTVLMYALICLLCIAFDQRSYRALVACLVLCISMVTLSFGYTLLSDANDRLVVFHADKSAAVQVVAGNSIVQLTDTVPDRRLAATLRENVIRNDASYLREMSLGKVSLILAGGRRILFCADGALVTPALMGLVKPQVVWLPARGIKRKKQRRAFDEVQGALVISGKLYKTPESLTRAWFTQNKGAFTLSLQP
jgi:competence protein ComEC